MWEGPDHLLWVERAAMQERYKRFYYNDIQAFVLVKNNNQHLWTFIWGAFALLFGVVALSVSGTPYVSSVCFGFCILMICVNLLMGSCCKTYIQTAVQREKLRHLVRIKKANKILNQIKTMVEEKQGVLIPDQISQCAKIMDKPAPLQPDSEPTRAEGSQANAARNQSASIPLQWGFFGLLSLVGGIKYSQNWLQSPVMSILEIAGLAILMVLGIITLVRLRGKKASTVLLTFDWIALVLVIIQSIADYIIFFLASIRNASNNAMPYDFLGILKIFINMLNGGNPLITGMGLGFGLANLTIGLIGMLLLIRRKK